MKIIIESVVKPSETRTHLLKLETPKFSQKISVGSGAELIYRLFPKNCRIFVSFENKFVEARSNTYFCILSVSKEINATPVKYFFIKSTPFPSLRLFSKFNIYFSSSSMHLSYSFASIELTSYFPDYLIFFSKIFFLFLINSSNFYSKAFKSFNS